MSVTGETVFAVAYRVMSNDPPASDESVSRPYRIRRKAQSAAAEGLLRDLLHRAPGISSSSWTLAKDLDGRPILTAPDGSPATIRVSLSHSARVALAAITNLGEIGVDVELRNPRRSIREIATYAFGPAERRIVECDGMRAFYRIWTLREAFAKANGIGFPLLADGRDYFSDAPDSGIWQSIIDGRQWLFSTGDLSGDYAFAVALAPRPPFEGDCAWDLTPRELA